MLADQNSDDVNELHLNYQNQSQETDQKLQIRKPRILFLPSMIKCSQTGKWIITQPFQEKNQLYIDAITKPGGEVIQIDYDSDLTDIISNIDGWYIPGGCDIDPSNYNQPAHPQCRVGKYSQIRKVPILGVCYGMQFLNVVHGGTLVQHIENPELHECNADQNILMRGPNFLSKIFNNATEISVGCSHHQSVDVVGQGFTITVSEERWIVAVQFHPERKEHNGIITDHFVEVCRQFQKNKSNL